jgi:dolichyl-phosphate-mannose--protein O-mannosyl transferase
MTVNMHSGNMEIQQFHEWPILYGVMTFFGGGGGHPEIRCLGNVFSSYFALLGLAAVVFGFTDPRWTKALMFLVGWATCYFPFFLIPRVMYQYHDLIPLMLVTMAFGAALDIFVPKKRRQVVAVIVIGLAVFGFWLWSPYVYGTERRAKAQSIWTCRWIDGSADHQSRMRSRDLAKSLSQDDDPDRHWFWAFHLSRRIRC